jgi:hypothetical protein
MFIPRCRSWFSRSGRTIKSYQTFRHQRKVHLDEPDAADRIAERQGDDIRRAAISCLSASTGLLFVPATLNDLQFDQCVPKSSVLPASKLVAAEST